MSRGWLLSTGPLASRHSPAATSGLRRMRRRQTRSPESHAPGMLLDQLCESHRSGRLHHPDLRLLKMKDVDWKMRVPVRADPAAHMAPLDRVPYLSTS